MAFQAKLADITKIRNVEAITNAANGDGIMGRGVAGAIVKAAGEDFKKQVYRYCQDKGGFKPGEVYVTPSGDLTKIGIKSVYHAVTMRHPGGPTSYDVVSKVFRTLLQTAIKDKIASIAIPGLGTGIGGLDSLVVAQTMFKISSEYVNKINIAIVDIDDVLIDEVKRLMNG